MPNPACEVKDGAGAYAATTNGVDVTPGNTVTIHLIDTSADTWSIECVYTDETSDAATVTAGLTIDSNARTATFTAPAAGKAYIFRSRVNNGLGPNGKTQSSYTTTFGIYTLTDDGRRVIAANETTEGGPFGWVATVNDDIRNGGGGSTDGANVGDKLEVFKDRSGGALRMRTIDTTSNILTSGAQDADVLKLRPSPPGWFNVRDFGAVGNGSTDDSLAIRKAIVAAKQYASSGDSVGINLSGGVVYFPPGSYRCAARIPVDGPVTLQGATGRSQLGGTVLMFDQDLDLKQSNGLVWVTRNTNASTFTRADNTAYDLNSIVKSSADDGRTFRCETAGTTAGTEPAGMTGASVGDEITDGSVTWVCESATGYSGVYSSGDHAVINDIAVAQVRGTNRNNLLFAVGILVESQQVTLHNIGVDNISGHGVEITGATGYTNANNWHISGTCRISRCDGYGIFVHDGESNAGTFSGSLDVSGCKSWGIREKSFLGNAWTGGIHLAGNGAFYSVPYGDWVNNGSGMPARYVWSAAQAFPAGRIVVPSFANGSTGFWYIAMNAGTSGGTEPAWPTTIGNTVVDGDITWKCWLEEGGMIWSEGANAPKTWGWIYSEADQNPAQIDSPDTFAGAMGSFGWTESSAAAFGPAFGYLVPFSVQSLRETAPSTFDRPVKLLVGGHGVSDTSNAPYVGFGKYAGGATASGGYVPGMCVVRDFWNSSTLRWTQQAFRPSQSPSYYGFTSFSVAEGKSMPMPGAMCFPSLWLGSVVGVELRMTATQAKSTGAHKPDFASATGSGRGRFEQGDVVWNKPQSGRPSVPLAWRANKVGSADSHNTYATNFTYPAGVVIRPGTTGDPLYVATTGGTTSGSTPAFANTPGQTYSDGDVTWEWCGVYNDETHWEPAIAERPVMLTKDVSASGTVTLTADESGYARLKLTGTLTSNTTVIVEPGAASGWDKTIWNATTGNYTLTIKATSGGAGVKIGPGCTAHILADDTDARLAATEAGAAVAMSALDIDWSAGNVFTKTLAAGANAITFSKTTSGKVVIVRLTSDAGGSTVTWPTAKWSGGVPPTQTSTGTDVYTFFHDGTDIYGSVNPDMS